MKSLLRALASFGFSLSLAAQTSAPPRPHITGISHVGYFVSDLPKAIAFWHDLLGYDVAYKLNKPATNETRIAFIKLNDAQHIELFNEPSTRPPNMMSHLCFTVDNIETTRAFLRAQGFDVPPSTGAKTRTGDYAFEIRDPNGMLIEFVQSLPTGLERQNAGKHMPPTRISPRIYHAGYLVADAAKTVAFYKALGFVETWRGTPPTNPELSWINMRLPDSEDYVELMLFHAPLSDAPGSWGGKDHLSLAVADIHAAVATLEARPAFAAYDKPLKISTGINRKQQVNLFDPDGTRVELMETMTVDGKSVPTLDGASAAGLAATVSASALAPHTRDAHPQQSGFI